MVILSISVTESITSSLGGSIEDKTPWALETWSDIGLMLGFSVRMAVKPYSFYDGLLVKKSICSPPKDVDYKKYFQINVMFLFSNV